MLKGLWIGDGGCYSGFGVVNQSIIENLPEGDYDIHQIGINYFGDYWETKPWHKIFPAHLGGDLLGMGRIEVFIKNFKPDFIFILNDAWVITDYLRHIPSGIPTIAYFPVDAGPMQPEWTEALSRIAQPVAYTQYGKDEVLKVNPHLHVEVIPHGIDRSKFFHIDMEEACELMDGTIDPNEWIVFNGNRNQPRKRVDLTIKGFCEFVKDKPENVRLYLHMGLEDSHVRIDKLIHRYGQARRLYITKPDLTPANSVTVERLNVIYNCCDVGINTSLGEGWGLVPFEHAATGAPQLVPDNSASAEVFGEGRGYLIPCEDETITAPKILTEGEVVSVRSVADALQFAYDNPVEMQTKVDAMTEYINRPAFQWENIALQWDKLFKRVTGK